MVMFSLMLPVIMMLMGLAIDRTMLFIVEAKLGAAVDGAALGAGRLLGTNANTQEIAGEFLTGNFPTNYWGSRNLQDSITATDVLATHTITINASVDVPLLFMRMFTQGFNTVYASAVATRRDSRVVLVLDHSGSMSSVISSLQSGAKQFTAMFTPGTDEVGLVGFSGSAIVAYPIYTPPYDGNPLSTTQQGPDTGFLTSATAGPMITQINALQAKGGTNAAEALSMAYIELQKAHNRDLSSGVDDRLNAIVFFTDGLPTSISVSPNNPSANALKPYGSGSGHSPCTYNINGGTTPVAGTSQMAGWVTIFNNGPPWGSTAPVGLYELRAYVTGQTSNWWLGNGDQDEVASSPKTAYNNCTGLGAGGNFALTDLTTIPSIDYYGNSTGSTTGAYTQGASYASPCNVTYNPSQATNECQWGLAIWNTVDNVGNTIRNLGIMGSLSAPVGMLPVVISTIGYSGNGGVDAVLLKRLANTQDSGAYNSSQQSGQYVPVSSSGDLTAAFVEVASSLLRLAR
jgi:Flp pilus assembly protein TadG